MNRSEDLLKRMEALNRKPLKNRPEPETAETPSPAAKGWEGESAKPARTFALANRAFPAERSAPFPPYETPPSSRRPSGDGALCVLEEDIERHSPGLSRAFEAALASEDSPLRRLLRRTLHGVPAEIEHVVFLDLETAGLSDAPAFLIGTMVWKEGKFVVRQRFARKESEEPDCLAAFLTTLSPRSWLVTFNGKSFDAPFLRKRAERFGLPFSDRLPHLDMLPVSRRTWGDALPNCRLQTLERAVCGRVRAGDIPSAEIPRAYRDFLRTGDDSEIGRIIEHNALDLVTLAELTLRLPETPSARSLRRF